MLPVTSLSHVSVTVVDLEQARRFYGGLIGLREIARPDFGFPGAWYALGGDLQLHVTVGGRPPARPVGHDFDVKDPHFALWTDDADALAERLRDAGQPFYDFAATPTGLRQLFIRDPDGNMVEFLGPTRRPREVRVERRG